MKIATLKLNPARCPVCGVCLTGIPRLCGRCETPHHLECWNYNGGCAIYGCAPLRPAHPRIKIPENHVPRGHMSAPLDMLSGSLFGALIGTVVILTLAAWTHTPGHDGVTWLRGSSFWLACAVLLGAYTGAVVRGPGDSGRIGLCGIVGPGVSAWLVGVTVGLGTAAHAPDLAGAVFCLPFVALFGMVMAPLALPCAFLTGMFNDPRRSFVARALWLVIVACAVGFLVLSVSMMR